MSRDKSRDTIDSAGAVDFSVFFFSPWVLFYVKINISVIFCDRITAPPVRKIERKLPPMPEAEKIGTSYSPDEYRGFIVFLINRIDDPKILRKILAEVNIIFCQN